MRLLECAKPSSSPSSLHPKGYRPESERIQLDHRTKFLAKDATIRLNGNTSNCQDAEVTKNFLFRSLDPAIQELFLWASGVLCVLPY